MKKPIAFGLALIAAPLQARATEPPTVPLKSLADWWNLTSDLSANYEAMGYFLQRKVPAVSAEFEFTVTSEGLVADCVVIKKSDPDQPDDRLCALIAGNEYAPSESNGQRLAVRTTTSVSVGTSASQTKELLSGDKKE